ncbi:hypothetical protein TSAR_015382 [Trichomalopsis sarcophagae]|uniref:Uncharacterized protein n=1 Tax=Trichomalopsis sarcophagae TaxID=543379 RepID=A0A232FBB2_9HYME|nr:hypothetical protein TSAR_015382 [Trichomalopsis sarcophagae]
MGREELMIAVQTGTYLNVQAAFKDEYLAHDEEWFDYKLLMAAIERSHKTIVHFLLDKNCRVRREETTESFHTPLYHAVLLDDYQLVKKMILNGASIKDKHFTHQTPICLAIKKGRDFLADAILRLANFNDISPTNVDDIAHFQIACMREKLEVVEKFVEHGFSLETVSVLDDEKWKGFTPLHFAIMGSDKRPKCQTAMYLINKGADIYTKNFQGQTPLHLAYYSNNYEKMQKSISLAISSQKEKFSNPVDKNGVSHFHICCMCNITNCVETFIKKKVNINTSVSADLKNDAGFTPLHFAIKKNCLDMVQILLKKSAQVNKPAKDGLTPLHLACKLNHIKIVKLLLKYKADVNAVGESSCTPIHCAFYASPRSYELIDLLLSSVPKNSNYSDSRGLSYFHIASAQNNTAMVESLLNLDGISIDARINLDDGINSGYSALHLAVDYNCKDVVELLLQHNANANIAMSSSDIRPLHLACNYNNNVFLKNKKTYWKKKKRGFNYVNSLSMRIEIMEILLDNKADINAKTSKGKTVLMYACLDVSNVPDSIINFLIANNADINMRTNKKSTILHLFANCKEHLFSKVVEWSERFLLQGANVDAINDHDCTPLLVAFRNESFNLNYELIKLLLNHGANINARSGGSKNTPLHYLIERSYPCEATMDLLLNNGSNIEAKNMFGHTPLQVAFSRGQLPAIKKLLRYGADINSENPKGFPTINPFSSWRGIYCMCKETTKVIEVHIKKLITIGFHISDKVKRSYGLLKAPPLNLPREADDVFIQCSEEIKKLKNARIDNYTTLYNILFRDQNEMVKHLKNKTLTEILNDPSLERKFPLYGYLLKLQLKKGLVRENYSKPAKTSLELLIGMSLPDSCSESILGYLRNRDLVNLNKAIKLTGSIKRKLQVNNSKSEVPSKKRRR